MVHGAGNDLWGPASIKARWFPALADGLAWHDTTVDDDDVAVAFYGDLFRPDPEDGYQPPVDVKAAMAKVEEVASRLDPQLDLHELLAQLAEHHFDRLLAQATAYLQQPELRRRARARVADAVGPDTRVVVAHSLGTLVAYEALCAHPDWPVTDFVTIGCPLAAQVVHPLLDPCPEEGRGCWPGPVQRWTNIADGRDPAAANPLRDQFAGDVTEYHVDNGHRVHDPEPYLNNRWTGLAVTTALTQG